MFSYTGLTAPQVLRLRAEHHVYMLESGRLSMAGVTSQNVEPLAAAIAAVLGEPLGGFSTRRLLDGVDAPARRRLAAPGGVASPSIATPDAVDARGDLKV